MDIQIVDGNIAIVDGNTMVKVFPLDMNMPISNWQRYSYKMRTGSSYTINPIGINVARGLFIASNGNLDVISGNNSIYGKTLHIDGAEWVDLTIEPDSIEKDRGDLSENASHEDNVVTLTDKLKNFTHSRLQGTKLYPVNITGGGYSFFVEGTYRFQITDYTAMQIELTTVQGETEEEAISALTSLLQTKINEMAGKSIVEVYYEDNSLIIQHTEPGSNHMEFTSSSEFSQIRLGMDTQILRYGTEDYSGLTIKFISGPLVGNDYTITSIDGTEIQYTKDAAHPLPVSGDSYVIVNEAANQEVTVNILVYK